MVIGLLCLDEEVTDEPTEPARNAKYRRARDGREAGADMTEPLIVVDGTFKTHEDDLVLSPFLPHQVGRKVRVRYETLDGAGGTVNGRIEAATGRVWAPGKVSPAHQSAVVIDGPGHSIPVGTRIWIVEDAG
jgi:hypothetical protein